MAKYDHSKDKKVSGRLSKELEHFEDLVKGHEKLLYAIGEL